MTPQAPSALLIRVGVYTGVLVVLAGIGWLTMVRMPGTSYRGPLPPLTDDEIARRDALRRDVEQLAGTIGERNTWRPDRLTAAAAFLEDALNTSGYQVQRQAVMAGGVESHNLEAERRGGNRAEDVVIIGAHYDSVIGSPGANDNATGAAAVLALARAFAGTHPARTLRFVEFVNEEPPYFQTPEMGSLVYAMRCRQRNERVVAMLSLETMGYYTDQPGTQQYPFPFNLFYPSTGNFIGFVSDLSSRRLLHDAVASFRRSTRFPSEGAAALVSIPGVGWSDQWSFWRAGYPAIMVTDTAPFRYPHYHTAQDTPDKLDYDRLSRVVGGLQRAVADLAGLKL